MKTTHVLIGGAAAYLLIGVGVWLERRAVRAEYCSNNPGQCPALPSPSVALLWPIAVSTSANA